MLTQGRDSGSALVAAAMALVWLSSVINFEAAQAETWRVGGDMGWPFNCSNWTKGKSFKAGDILEFRYNAEEHDLLVVTKAVYHGCNATAGAPAYHTGHDDIKLVAGHHFFICNFPGHCKGGYRMAVKVLPN